jgi:hypothetical protein
MKKVSLLFPTIVELIDFENQMETENYETDREQLVMTGQFSDREIELAVNAYFARVLTEN